MVDIGLLIFGVLGIGGWIILGIVIHKARKKAIKDAAEWTSKLIQATSFAEAQAKEIKRVLIATGMVMEKHQIDEEEFIAALEATGAKVIRK